MFGVKQKLSLLLSFGTVGAKLKGLFFNQIKNGLLGPEEKNLYASYSVDTKISQNQTLYLQQNIAVLIRSRIFWKKLMCQGLMHH